MISRQTLTLLRFLHMLLGLGCILLLNFMVVVAVVIAVVFVVVFGCCDDVKMNNNLTAGRASNQHEPCALAGAAVALLAAPSRQSAPHRFQAAASTA